MKEEGGVAVTESSKRPAKVMNMQARRPGLMDTGRQVGPPNSRDRWELIRHSRYWLGWPQGIAVPRLTADIT
jgi:hypothetical protein